MKLPALNAQVIIILATLTLTTACQATPEQKSEQASEPAQVNATTKTEITQTADCPIISSQNWSAEILPTEGGKSTLVIKGDIELPNPGYSVVFEEGIADKRSRPSQHFTIKAERLNGFYIQAVTPMILEHSGVAIAKQYKSIIIGCGGQTIATIDNVIARR